MSTSTPNITHQPPPLFDGINYSVWAVQMKAYLRGFNLWDVVENDTEVSPLRDNASAAQVKQYEKDVAKRYRALSFFHSAVFETIFSRIIGCETAKEVWDTLQEEFLGNTRTRHMQLLNLRREFELMRMKDTQTVKEYVDQVMKLINQIRMLGEKLSETSVVQKILISIPEKFEATVASLEQSKDPIKLTITEIISALQATKKGKFKVRMHCKKCNHSVDNCWFKPDAKCKVCNELGHINKVCKNKSSATEKVDQSTEKAHVEEETLFMALTTPNSDVHNDQRLLDSGSSNHITPLESMLVDLDKDYKSKVKIGNGLYLDVVGKGTVSIHASAGIRTYFLRNGNVLESNDNQNVDDVPVRGTRSIDDIYHRSLVITEELTTFAEATKCPKWRATMHEELNMINKNQTWSLVNRPSNHHVIGVKWIFKKKLNPDDNVNKFKARLVAKGFNQLPGIDNMETFALVARFDTIRLLLALSTALSWNLYHFDIKSAFLNGVLEEEIFMEQLDGFIQNPNEDKVFKLHKALTTQVSLSGYSDSDWAGNIDDIRSTSGYVFTLGNGPFSWSFHKQTLVAQSSAEAEYITASVASNLAIWLRKVLANLKLSQCHSTPLLVDNKSAIANIKKSSVSWQNKAHTGQVSCHS
ncbi:CCHC-type integrase-like protein [Theobroma cacao]|uniref:CCHC-type integrase-like protein n=1 Tax=Theobroma cacao TaxID=3641 RepID=A0A061ESK1_THECC|nr:CCHC-type integrase-like protein [Theobroma cacao]